MSNEPRKESPLPAETQSDPASTARARGARDWHTLIEQAIDFDASIKAIRFCMMSNLDQTEAVYNFEDPADGLAVPLDFALIRHGILWTPADVRQNGFAKGERPRLRVRSSPLSAINCHDTDWKTRLVEQLQRVGRARIRNFDYTVDGEYCETLAHAHQMVLRVDRGGKTGRFTRQNRPGDPR